MLKYMIFKVESIGRSPVKQNLIEQSENGVRVRVRVRVRLRLGLG